MIKDPFSTFIELVEFDKGLIDINREIAKAQEAQESLNKKMSFLQGSIKEAKRLREVAQKDVDSKELELKELDELIKEKKEKLKTVSNQKEFAALKKELDASNKDQLSAESDIVALWNKLETAKKDFVEKEKTLQSQIADLEKELQENQNKIDTLQANLKDLQGQRSAKEEGVPEEWKMKYQLMHGQVKDPVSPVVSESCSSCFYHVTSQDMIDLKHKKLMQCKGCYRFLYLKEAFSNQSEL